MERRCCCSDSRVSLSVWHRSRARSRERTLAGALREALLYLEGAFSLVFLSQDRIIVARDPHGFRPLALVRDGARTSPSMSDLEAASWSPSATSRAARRARAARSCSTKSIANGTIGPSGWSRNSNSVTTPKLPPPPQRPLPPPPPPTSQAARPQPAPAPSKGGNTVLLAVIGFVAVLLIGGLVVLLLYLNSQG